MGEATKSEALDQVIVLGTIGFFLLLYGLTLCPTVFWYDSAEYATAAATLGIPHPPGYPLYTLVGYLFTLLPLEPAAALNLMSAVFGALAVGCCYLLAREIGARSPAALVAAATLGTTELFWSQALIAEVYTPALAALGSVTLLLLRGLQRRRPALVLTAAGLAGLCLGFHLSIATCGLGFALLVWSYGADHLTGWAALAQLADRKRVFDRLKLGLGAVAATLAGSAIFVYVPLRAAMKPALNFADPSNLERFLWMLGGGNYGQLFQQGQSLHSQWLGSGGLLDRVVQLLAVFQQQVLVVGLALATLGLAQLTRRRPIVGLALLLMMVGNIGFFFDYAVHDIEVFLLPSLLVICALIGVGLDATLQAIARLSSARRKKWLVLTCGGVLACLPSALLLVNGPRVDLRGYTAAREYGEKLSSQLPPDAVLLDFMSPPEWKTSAVFAMYFQKALKRRPDVRVISLTDPSELPRLLARGVPVYLYYPLPQAQQFYLLAKEGVAYRVVRPRRRPLPRAP